MSIGRADMELLLRDAKHSHRLDPADDTGNVSVASTVTVTQIFTEPFRFMRLGIHFGGAVSLTVNIKVIEIDMGDLGSSSPDTTEYLIATQVLTSNTDVVWIGGEGFEFFANTVDTCTVKVEMTLNTLATTPTYRMKWRVSPTRRPP